MQEFLHVFQQYYKEDRQCFDILVLLGIFLQYTLNIDWIHGPIYFIIAAIIVLEYIEPCKEEYAIYNTQDCLLQAFSSATFCFVNFAGTFQWDYLISGYVSAVLKIMSPIIFRSMHRMWTIYVVGNCARGVKLTLTLTHHSFIALLTPANTKTAMAMYLYCSPTITRNKTTRSTNLST